MFLDLNDDQISLRDGIRALLAGRFGPDRIREGFDRSMFTELSDAGVFALVADGFSWADATVVFEQLGEFCVPGPLVGSFLVGDGSIVGVVDADSPLVIEHLDVLDSLAVVGPDSVRRVDASTIAADPLDWPLDPLTPVWRAHSLPDGVPLADADANAWRDRGAVLTAALCLGLAQRLTAVSVAYSLERHQFDRPIGGFQAIKHLLADMAVRTEVARAAVYNAGAHLDAPDVTGLARSVGVAKALAGEAAIRNGKDATQVHGGMGYTWEVDVHLWLKRAWVLDTHFGSHEHHFDQVAATLARATA
jgi:alkylation response protein AidB-like acyl-CoA dehydrogenase